MDYLNGDGSQPRWLPDDSAGADGKPDRYGEEMGEDANIWRVYAKVAKDADKEMVEWWNRGLDNLAVFAGLFSAATIAFIIEARRDMKRDFTELTFRAMTTNASYARMLDETFAVHPSARLVNSLWISSLLLSLSAAMIAMMGKDWIASYGLADRSNVRDWALLRQHRLDSVLRWKMPWLIASAPHLLHCALALFVTGLVLLTYPLDPHTGVVAATLAGIIAFVYIGLKISTIVSRDSPFRSLGFSAYPPRTSPSQGDHFPIPLWLSTVESVLESASRGLHDPLMSTQLLIWRIYRAFPHIQFICTYSLLWLRALRALPSATRSKSPWTHVPSVPPISWWSNALNWLYATGQPRDFTAHAIFRAIADLTYGASVFSELDHELQFRVRTELRAEEYATYHLRTAANATSSSAMIPPFVDARIRLYRDSVTSGECAGDPEDALIALSLLGEGLQLGTTEEVRELCRRNSSVRIHAATMKGLLFRLTSPHQRASTDSLAHTHVKALCILNTWKDAFAAAPDEMMRALRATLPTSISEALDIPLPLPRPCLLTSLWRSAELVVLLVFPLAWPMFALLMIALEFYYEVLLLLWGGESIRERFSSVVDTGVLKAVGLWIARALKRRLRNLGMLTPDVRDIYPYNCTKSTDCCQLIRLLVAIIRDEVNVGKEDNAVSPTPNRAALADAVDLLLYASCLHPHDRDIAHIDVSLTLGGDYEPGSDNALQEVLRGRDWLASEVSAVLHLTPGLYGIPRFSRGYCDAQDVMAYLTPAIFTTMVLDPTHSWFQPPLSPGASDALVDCCTSLSRRFQVSTTNLRGLDPACYSLLRQLLSGATLEPLSAAPRSTFVQLLTRIALFLRAVPYIDRTPIFAGFAASSARDPVNDSFVLREPIFAEFAASSAHVLVNGSFVLRRWSLLSALPVIVRDCVCYSAETEDVQKLLSALSSLRQHYNLDDVSSSWDELAAAVWRACNDMRHIPSVDNMLTEFCLNMGYEAPSS